MSNVTPGSIRGFLIPFKNQSLDNLWEAESTITQGTGRAGIPVNENIGSDLVLTASGELTDSINIKTVRPGHLSNKPGFVWKESTQTEYNGFDQPNIITDTNIFIDHGGVASDDYYPTDSIQLSNNSIMVVYEKSDLTDNIIYVAIKSYTTKVISTYTIQSTKTLFLSGNKQYPALCQLPDGSIICAYWVNDDNLDTAQIEVSRSEDQGVNWTVISSRAIKDDIDTSGSFGAGAAGFELGRLSMAANSHSVLLFAGVTAHNEDLSYASIVLQFASTSEGTFFNKISESGTIANYADPQVVSYNEVFIISFIDSADTIGFTRLPNAFEDLQNRLTVIALDNKTTFGTLPVAKLDVNRWIDFNRSMWIDNDGRLYCAHTLDSNTGDLYYPSSLEIWFSDLKGLTFDQYGKTWEGYGQPLNAASGQLCINSSSTNGFSAVVGSSGVGAIELFVKWGSGTTNQYENSIFRITMGGYGTVNYPALVKYPQDQNTAYNTLDWIPIDLPTQGATWTAGTTGSPTSTLDKKLTLEGTSGAVKVYYRAITDKTGGCIMRAKIRTRDVGTSDKGAGISIQIQEKTSTDTIWAKVELTHNAIYLQDGHSAGNVTSATGLSSLAEFDIILYVNNDSGKKAHVWYAESPGNLSGPRRYNQLQLTLTTNSSTTQRVSFGILSNPGHIKTEIYYVSYAQGDATGMGFEDIYPKQYPAQGYQVAINRRLKISTQGGPARENESYSISPVYDTPLDRVLYDNSPSRQVKWISDPVNDADNDNVPQEKIAWFMDSGLQENADTKPLSDSIGIHLASINFRNITIEKYSGGSWSTFGTYNNVHSVFNFQRKGNAIICTDLTGKYLHFNEAADYELLLDNGAGTTLNRKVISNSAGVLATSDTKNAVLRIKDPKSTDPTSGTAHLIPKDVTLVMGNIGEFAALRINMNSQKTSSGRFEIGNMIIGPVIIPAHQYSRGRTISFEADVQETTAQNGVLYTNKTGIGGRVIRIAWTEGVDISELYNSAADPDYYKQLSAGEAIAAVGSAPTTSLGLVEYLNGSRTAIVYLPNIKTGTNIKVINHRHDHVLCTMGNDVQIENIVGNESTGLGAGEVFRVSTIVLRETR